MVKISFDSSLSLLKKARKVIGVTVSIIGEIIKLFHYFK